MVSMPSAASRSCARGPTPLMRRGVDLLELVDRHVGVDLGALQGRVPEQRLDEADIRTVVEHVRGAGVAEQVRCPGFVDAGEGVAHK